MARSLVQLTHLEVSNCQTMQEIVSIADSDEMHMKGLFSKLQHLELQDLPILTRFCSRSYTGNPSGENLRLENDNIIEERDCREELENALFDEKVIESSIMSYVVMVLSWFNLYLICSL